ncbi:MAG: hypothetical protein KatS3mg061_1083 [Dehalococcoidia bacterium]|nr:MAG: hypothetical protein KatS3mg061_1083 [Dehalococcoidia bacterium]
MVERLLRWRLLSPNRSVRLLAVDPDANLVTAAARQLRTLPPRWRIEFDVASLAELAERSSGQFDFVIAHHLLDLLPLSSAVADLLRLLRPGGVFWATLNFDGLTEWFPPLALDRTIGAAYHASMDQPDEQRSQTGRRLLAALGAAGAQLGAIGSSDWVIAAREGGYTADELVVLETMLEFHRQATAAAVGLTAFERWLVERQRQIAAGELVLIVHQLDVAGRAPASGSTVQPVGARRAASRAR